ncbi:ATP-binding protein [Vibrio sp. JC009]|uniref:PAS domain-containing hybrid sensor histidine kinase/response regulator n=1 Tax=Vibrio sp. JC009 TaxID=2912314 RepID=UPI0023AF03A7|nr:PAS domain-containing sensor histidine kinase [Vibrio sp. JC009]WED21382.1 ATP-binding protein [Vibrio sp. JC009]
MHSQFAEGKVKLLKLILDTIPCRVFWKDRDQVYRGANKLFIQDAGLASAEALIGKTDLELPWAEDQGSAYQADDLQIMQSGKAILAYEEQQTQVDGSVLWLETSKIPLRNENNEIIGVLGTYVDITARKLAEQRLEEFNTELEQLVEERTAELSEAHRVAEQALEARSQFLANVSHEIRTPMTGILGMVELLMLSDLKEEDQRCLDIIQHSGKTLLTVLNDILDYSKLDAGKLSLNSSSVDLADFLQQTITPYKVSVSNRLEIDLYLEQSLVGKRFLLDSVRIHQVLSNLLNNACKFTEEGFVRLAVAGKPLDKKRFQLEFSVTDSGIGIAPEKQREIFNPFTQSDQSTARQYGGTGLGLSICSQILALMESQLAVESNAGEGTRFSFNLVLEQDRAGEPEDTEQEAEPSLQEPKLLNVLLVEDNKINQMVCSKLLEHLGTKVEIANDGSEVVNLITEEQRCYDIILMDCQMPVMDGYEATRRIRRWEAENDRQRSKIIALTAHTLPEHVEQCIAAGMDAHLSKPLNVAEIKQLLTGEANSR